MVIREGYDVLYVYYPLSGFTPGMSDAVRRFVRNCDECGAMYITLSGEIEAAKTSSLGMKV
jgi:hypothetical protein